MLNSTTAQASTNGNLLPQSIAGKVLVGGQPFNISLTPAVSEAGNTRYEWVDHQEIASEAEGKKLCDGFQAKFDGMLLVAGKVHKSAVKNKVGKGGTAYTSGGNTCVSHDLADPVVIGGRNYRVTAGVTIVERSRNRVSYLSATISMKAILQGSGNGPKATGETQPASDF